jgi:hypothetical protein
MKVTNFQARSPKIASLAAQGNKMLSCDLHPTAARRILERLATFGSYLHIGFDFPEAALVNCMRLYPELDLTVERWTTLFGDPITDVYSKSLSEKEVKDFADKNVHWGYITG